MTLPDPNPSHEIAAPRTHRRRWWLTLLLSLVIFVSGFIAGGGTAVVMLGKYTRENITNPPLAMQRLLSFLQRRLDLNDEQTWQVAEILKSRQKRLLEIRRDVQPKVEGELQQLEEQVGEVLAPQQQERWRAMVAHLRAKWIPPLPPTPSTPPSQAP